VGEGEGQGFTANVPLPAASGEDAYASAFAGLILPMLREYCPDCLIVSAGFDAHVDDLLGGMALEAESFGRFAASLVALMRDLEAPPPAFVMEGGYDLNALTDSVASTIEGVERDSSPGWEYSGGVKPVDEVRRELASFWESLR
jgi:acetoin utilization deacetylase AcuC-like enzyme